MNGVDLTPLRRISVPNGDVLHAIKATDQSFAGFGEAYFSMIEQGAVKGWKRHRAMVMNLVVPVGTVRFVVRAGESPAEAESFVLSPDSAASYVRLTVRPGLWMAFQGLGPGPNLVLNFASIVHDPHEADNLPLDAFAWEWHAPGARA